MSKPGHPLDWDYAPVAVTEIQAAQGGVGYGGKFGDIVNCLIPYSDDVLLVGCDRSIWQIAGDPMGGGKRDLLTDAVGIAFGQPYCKTKSGDIFFFGTDCRVYQMPPGRAPQEISMEINPLIVNTNLNTSVIKMVFDDKEDGFHMFITPLTNGAATHWFFDGRTGAWFKNAFANTAYNPTCIHRLQGDESTDRLSLIGSEDGYIRYFANNTYADDGTAFMSYVVIGPFSAQGGQFPHILQEIQAVLDTSSGSILYEVASGDSPDAALANFAGSFTGDGSFAAGRSLVAYPQERGYYTYLKIGTITNTNWSLEEIRAKISVIVSSKGRN